MKLKEEKKEKRDGISKCIFAFFKDKKLREVYNLI